MSYNQLIEKLEIIKDRDTVFVKVGGCLPRLRAGLNVVRTPFIILYNSGNCKWSAALGGQIIWGLPRKNQLAVLSPNRWRGKENFYPILILQYALCNLRS